MSGGLRSAGYPPAVDFDEASLRSDSPIAAGRASLRNPECGAGRRLAGLENPAEFACAGNSGPRDWAVALRLHQWLKNLLIFVPLLAAHRLGEPALLLDGLLAFVLFGLCASSVYLSNDLLDLRYDRRHPRKRGRPFAAGRLSQRAGIGASVLLLAASFAGAAMLFTSALLGVLCLYYGLALAYSLSLKRRAGVDVITLAFLYTLRIFAGAVVFGLPLTFWIVTFSLFMFLSLALLKRYTELRCIGADGSPLPMPGRGYRVDHARLVAPLGVAAGFASVVVLAFYVMAPATSALYSEPGWIWLACPLLLTWIARVWVLAHRGMMHDDPVVFAITDRASLITGALFGAAFWMAS